MAVWLSTDCAEHDSSLYVAPGREYSCTSIVCFSACIAVLTSFVGRYEAAFLLRASDHCLKYGFGSELCEAYGQSGSETWIGSKMSALTVLVGTYYDSMHPQPLFHDCTCQPAESWEAPLFLTYPASLTCNECQAATANWQVSACALVHQPKNASGDISVLMQALKPAWALAAPFYSYGLPPSFCSSQLFIRQICLLQGGAKGVLSNLFFATQPSPRVPTTDGGFVQGESVMHCMKMDCRLLNFFLAADG